MKIAVFGDSWPWSWDCFDHNNPKNNKDKTVHNSDFCKTLKKYSHEVACFAQPGGSPDDIIAQLEQCMNAGVNPDCYVIFYTDPLRLLQRHHDTVCLMSNAVNTWWPEDITQFKTDYWNTFKWRLKLYTSNKTTIILGGCQNIHPSWDTLDFTVLPNIRQWLNPDLDWSEWGNDWGWATILPGLENLRPTTIDWIDTQIQLNSSTAVAREQRNQHSVDVWHLNTWELQQTADWVHSQLPPESGGPL